MPEYLVFEGKQDLEKRMVRRIRGWLLPDSVFIVLRDQDSGDCRTIKERLVLLCREAGRPSAIVRIACRSLESWFVGDWDAVSMAFNLPKLSNLKRKSLYQTPDALGDPVTELRKYIPNYQKRDGARKISKHLDLTRNRSHSFQVFIQTIKKLCGTVP